MKTIIDINRLNDRNYFVTDSLLRCFFMWETIRKFSYFKDSHQMLLQSISTRDDINNLPTNVGHYFRLEYGAGFKMMYLNHFYLLVRSDGLYIQREGNRVYINHVIYANNPLRGPYSTTTSTDLQCEMSYIVVDWEKIFKDFHSVLLQRLDELSIMANYFRHSRDS